jgi:D-alanyl-D-alanine carboxypeptidase
VRPASVPNYQLRRLVALTLLVVVGYSVFRIGGAVGSAFRGPRGAQSNPSGSLSSSPTPSGSPGDSLLAVPPCVKGNAATPDTGEADWATTLVDTRLRLPASYVPTTLVSVAAAGFENAKALLIRSLVVDDLTSLRQAARDAGNPIDIVAAYRSFQEQSSLFQRRKEQLGLAQAERKTARPGHSEHQLGTAIDFKTLGETDVTARWDTTPAGRWVLENAWRFGFIQSYPNGKTEETCYSYEPWHYRYFGKDLAAIIHQSGLTVREYLWKRAHAVP